MGGNDDHMDGIDVVEKSAAKHTHGQSQRKDTSDDAWDGGVHADAEHEGATPTLGTSRDFDDDDDTDVLTRGLRQKAAQRKSQKPAKAPAPQGPPVAVWFAAGFGIGGVFAALLVLLLG